MHLKKLSKGFTLIELLVVVGIIVIIASLVIVNITQARTNSRDAKRIADLKSIQNALEIYYEKAKEYPSSSASLATDLEKYIDPLPKDPLNGKTDINVVTGPACSDKSADSSALTYSYITNAAAPYDSYKLKTRLEVRCEGITENDGGPDAGYYELWGGKSGKNL